MFSALHARGLEPSVTLYHFTLPQWFQDLGGFEHEDNIHLFVRYACTAVEFFGDQVHGAVRETPQFPGSAKLAPCTRGSCLHVQAQGSL